jgi:transglutaminase-like putative cysteine protease
MPDTIRGTWSVIWRFPLAWSMTSLCLAVSLHAAQLPLWVPGLFASLCVWRVLLAVRGARLPSRPMRMAAVVVILLAVLGAYRTLNGIDAGTALLSLMAGLKLLETRGPRDHVVVVMICYFLLLAAFLREQGLWLLPLHALIVWIATTTLLRATQSARTMTPGESLRYSGRMLAQALPLMLVLFVLFPRVAGPFWGLPAGERGLSGLDDEMNPGAISELSLSSEAAFRARFHGAVPPPARRYWRGPVLHDFDGARWRAARGPAIGGELSASGPAYDYSLMLEPTGRRWVFALDMPVSWPTSWGQRLERIFDYQLLSRRPIDRPVTLELRSQTAYTAGATLSYTLRRLDTRLPANRNPRTLALATRMRAAVASDQDYIRDVLDMFREQEFFYTLTPPKLDRDGVDDFLFSTRSGFCEHYASAFAVLMRAAGIPARVVTGYQGGEYNRMGEYWIVRQSDAHAWTEVWLAGRGWSRVDPTAAVAPERIERGASEFIGEQAPVTERLLRRYSWMADMRDLWDAIDTVWRERVLKLDYRAQLELLEKLGLERPGWRALVVALAIGLALALALLGLLLARELRQRNPDPAVREYHRFCRRLERSGIARAPHEGPVDFAHRIARLRPHLAEQADAITRLYIALRYGGRDAGGADGVTSNLLAALTARVRRFKPAAG